MDLLQNFFPCISGGTLEGCIQQLLQQLVNGVAKGSIYALIALGYTMVYGIVELINFAHGDLFMLGSFFALTIVGAAIGADPAGHNAFGWPLLILLLTAVPAFCATLNWLIDRLAYRPLRN